MHDCGATRTRSQLTRDLRLARGTASVLVAGLVEDALLHEEPAREHGRGRPTQVPGPHPYGPVALAVDVREDAWELAECELGGRITVLEVRPHDGTPKGALRPLGAALAAHRERLGNRFIGVGVALAGPVRHGGLVDIAHLGWNAVDVPALLAAGARGENHPAGRRSPSGTAGAEATGRPHTSADLQGAHESDAPGPPHTVADSQGADEAAAHHRPHTSAPSSSAHGTGSPGLPPAIPDPCGAHETDAHHRPHTSAPSRAARVPGGTGAEGAAGASSGPYGSPDGEAETGRGAFGGMGMPVVGNDTAFAALAEARRGRLRDVRVGLHLHVDFDLGGVLVVDGRPVAGAGGVGAEFGHMTLTGSERLCACGALGCWGADVGANALLRHAGLAHGGGRGREEAERVLATGAAAVEETARTLGRGIASLVNAHDPEVVTLSGHGPELYERAGAALLEACEPYLMAIRRERPPRIEASALGWRGALLGAMESVFDAFLTVEGLEMWRDNHPDQARDTPGRQSVTHSTPAGDRA